MKLEKLKIKYEKLIKIFCKVKNIIKHKNMTVKQKKYEKLENTNRVA